MVKRDLVIFGGLEAHLVVDGVRLLESGGGVWVFNAHSPDHSDPTLEDVRARVQVIAIQGSGKNERKRLASRPGTDGISYRSSEPLEGLVTNRCRFAAIKALGDANRPDEMCLPAVGHLQVRNFVHQTYGLIHPLGEGGAIHDVASVEVSAKVPAMKLDLNGGAHMLPVVLSKLAACVAAVREAVRLGRGKLGPNAVDELVSEVERILESAFM